MMRIKNLLILMSVMVFGLVFSSSATAQHNREDNAFQVQFVNANIFLPPGNGISVGYHLFNPVYLGGEVLGGTWEGDETNGFGEVTEEWSVDFQTTQAILRVSPFSSSGLYLQAGIVSRSWEIEWTGYDINDDGLGGVDVATIALVWPDTAINYGIGWTWITDGGFSIGISLNTIAGDSPEVEIRDTGGLPVNDADLLQAEADLEEDNKDLTDLNYFAFSIGYNF